MRRYHELPPEVGLRRALAAAARALAEDGESVLPVVEPFDWSDFTSRGSGRAEVANRTTDRVLLATGGWHHSELAAGGGTLSIAVDGREYTYGRLEASHLLAEQEDQTTAFSTSPRTQPEWPAPIPVPPGSTLQLDGLLDSGTFDADGGIITGISVSERLADLLTRPLAKGGFGVLYAFPLLASGSGTKRGKHRVAVERVLLRTLCGPLATGAAVTSLQLQLRGESLFGPEGLTQTGLIPRYGRGPGSELDLEMRRGELLELVQQAGSSVTTLYGVLGVEG